MIAVDNVLISDAIVQEEFVCDLSKCKGGCCEEGDAGAPLEAAELDLMVQLYDEVKPYLTAESIAEIDRKGKYVYHREFGWVTPTLGNDNEICVYGIRDEKGIIKCAFEQAYNDGKTSWKKPISCHFFPIIQRSGRNGDFDRMNYEPREVLCKPACNFGKKLKVPVYQFLKEPIIRKYGEAFFDALDKAAKVYFPEGKK
ncbi:MAG: DUF3109 family protein [Candidatus Pseudobacter hemicellulosilyticus]|uniref:DUF3109 family protein n=1 Tax=Candidatus Pseudobacter hemicellulosilyticus TaxID=3121375 RepID=A0AAJ5WVC5_9BACT|nr:MAG: DUF3109 family protein [Pseudobacter sp.]